MIHPIYPQFDSDMIAAGIKQVLETEPNHPLRTYEIAQQTLDMKR